MFQDTGSGLYHVPAEGVKATAPPMTFPAAYATISRMTPKLTRGFPRLILAGLLLLVAWGSAAAGPADLVPWTYLPLVRKTTPPPPAEMVPQAYLPLVRKTTPPPPPPPTYEMRGLWVTRFDWTTYGQPAQQAKIDEIVTNAAAAGFNAIFFQVRGAADAYYAPGLEPWAQRISGGQLGQSPNPWWDPLAYFVNAAHARGIQLHAYMNVYPVWDNCSIPPLDGTSPRHFYYLLRDYHGVTGGKLDGLQWDTNGYVQCSTYLRATPASVYADTHYLAVANDLVTRYDIDGIHLDNIRYGGSNVSCDPVSQAAYGWGSCPDPRTNAAYADWQRAQVNGTVDKFYDQIVDSTDLWLSAAVWPVYRDYWGWGVNQGYSFYYQDSKAWLSGGYADAIMPMIYPSSYNCPDNSFWTQGVWQTLVIDFQASASGRYVVPGIGTGYCSFNEIEARINMARSIGTAGHALFSYGGLLANGYFDDLAAGPYAAPAFVPPISWHP